MNIKKILQKSKRVTWQRGTQSNECDRSDAILKTNTATEEGSQIANQGCQSTNDRH